MAIEKKAFFFIVILIGALSAYFVYRQQSKINQRTSFSVIKSTTTDPTLSSHCVGNVLPELTEGPYYKEGSPERETIRENNTPGTKLNLEGYVFGTDCKPISHAWIDFWQADGDGNYDNSGYLLRGHQYTDKNGRYKLLTVIPGPYPGRTEHIHFKIRSSEESRTMTSQLFFPQSTTNRGDSIFNDALVVSMTDGASGAERRATYNFIINR